MTGDAADRADGSIAERTGAGWRRGLEWRRLGVTRPRYAPAMALFVLTMMNGPEYDRSRPRREQRGWDEHAAFMDKLLAEGFVVLGGPIGDGEKVMLVVEAADEKEVRRRLGPDPWAPMGVLVIGSTQPWTIWLDSRPWTPAAADAAATPRAAASASRN